ncbi:MAG: hypothetical protein AB3N15_08050 [Paracoccaceae bacterium]
MSLARCANYIALPVLLVATALGIYWVWGLLFVWWIVPTLINGQAFLVLEINRDEDPHLFWLVVVLWAGLGGMMIAASLFPQFAHVLA